MMTRWGDNTAGPPPFDERDEDVDLTRQPEPLLPLLGGGGANPGWEPVAQPHQWEDQEEQQNAWPMTRWDESQG
jgi:hypothetical protein